MTTSTIMEVVDLSVEYVLPDRTIKAVSHVSLDVNKGEVIGIVGESGSGKSTLAMTFLKLLEYPGKIKSGKVVYFGSEGKSDVLKMKPSELRRYRWKEVSMIFQSAMNSLNPVMRIEDQMRDAMVEHGYKEEEVDKRIDYMLQLAGLTKNVRKSFPHELSGGMKQRVNIALALSCDPKILIADEATTALDVVVQRQILTRLLKLKDDLSISMIFITHDISLVANIADKVNVMYAGKIAESGPSNEIFANPQHPYTKALLASIPSLEQEKSVKGIRGTPPDLSEEIKGCPFKDRCDSVFDKCKSEVPELKMVSPGHYASCHLYGR